MATTSPAPTTARPQATASAPARSPRPPTAGPSASTFVLTITAQNSGQTFTVEAGARITIDLAPNGGSYDPPQAADPTVLHEDDHHGGYPDNTDAIAHFSAIKPGTSQINSQTDLPCLHTTPRCLPPQRVFRVTIDVR